VNHPIRNEVGSPLKQFYVSKKKGLCCSNISYYWFYGKLEEPIAIKNMVEPTIQKVEKDTSANKNKAKSSKLDSTMMQ